MGALTKPAWQRHSPAWLCAQHCWTCVLEQRETCFHPSPARGSLQLLQTVANSQGFLAQHCHSPMPVPYLLQGPWLMVTTMAVSAPFPDFWAASPQVLGQPAWSTWTQGISRKSWDVASLNKVTYSFSPALTNGSSALHLPSISLLHPGTARHCTWQVVCVGAAGKAALQGRGVRTCICRAPGSAAACVCCLGGCSFPRVPFLIHSWDTPPERGC